MLLSVVVLVTSDDVDLELNTEKLCVCLMKNLSIMEQPWEYLLQFILHIQMCVLNTIVRVSYCYQTWLYLFFHQ